MIIIIAPMLNEHLGYELSRINTLQSDQMYVINAVQYAWYQKAISDAKKLEEYGVIDAEYIFSK